MDIEELYASELTKPLLIYKFIGAGLVLAALDVLLTMVALNMGFVEANPFSNISNPLFLTYKFGVWLCMLPFVWLFSRKRKHEFGLLAVFASALASVCIYIFVVVWNSILIIGGLL